MKLAEYVEPNLSEVVGTMPEIFNRDVFKDNLIYILQHRETNKTKDKDYKLTKVKVANRLGVTRQSINLWLRNGSRPNILVVLRVNLWAKTLREQSRRSSVVSVS